jgi:hypothetical protein
MYKKKLISNYERSLLAEIEEREKEYKRKIMTLSVVYIITVTILTIRIATLGGI